MKISLSDAVISYLMKGGILLETKGDFETKVEIPMVIEEGYVKQIGIQIKCKDLSIRTIKHNKEEVE